jgi:hypothetical protein
MEDVGDADGELKEEADVKVRVDGIMKVKKGEQEQGCEWVIDCEVNQAWLGLQALSFIHIHMHSLISRNYLPPCC